MSHILEIRGGEPSVTRIAALTTAGQKVSARVKKPANIDGGYKFLTKYVQVFNTGGNGVRIFFNEADYTANADYVLIASGDPPFEGPAETRGIWVRSDAATTDVHVVFYQRRG